MSKTFNKNIWHVVSLCLAMMIPHVCLGAGFNQQMNIDDQTLYLNGVGPRKKAFLTIYDTALYLTEKGSDAKAIISADHPMAISLVIDSKLATAERISDAFYEGLEKSTGGNIEPIAAQVKAFLSVFEQGVVKGDAYQFAYLPTVGTRIIKNNETRATIDGAEFKQALFGIWLSDDPISDKLKDQLLGK